MERNSYLIIAKVILTDKRLSATARLLLAQLLDHRNKRTGECFPHEATLAQELGVTRLTVIRCLARLKKAGLLDVTRTQRGNRYKFPMYHFDTSQVSFSDSAKYQNDTSEPPVSFNEPYISEEERARAEARPRGSSPFPVKKPPRRQLSLVERTEALIAWRIANGMRPI